MSVEGSCEGFLFVREMLSGSGSGLRLGLQFARNVYLVLCMLTACHPPLCMLSMPPSPPDTGHAPAALMCAQNVELLVFLSQTP